MARMHGRRAGTRRFPAGSEWTADAIIGDGSGDGSGDDMLTVHIGVTL